MRNKTPLVETIITYICYILGAIAIVAMAYWTRSSNIWTDEAFTLAMIKHPYLDMIRLTANDVHPPLYYLLLKVWVDTAGVIVPGASAITLSKLFSTVVYAVTYVVGITLVRREFGNTISGLFVAFMLCYPGSIEFGVEIRMYQLAILFVTLVYIELHAIMTRTHCKRNWVAFGIFSLLGLYCQLFASLAIVMLYLCFLIWIYVFSGHSKKRLVKPFWTCAGIMIVCFLPWVVVVIRQFLNLQEDYWIDPITKADIPAYLNHLFPNLVFMGLSFAIIVVAIISAVFKKLSFDKFFYGMTGIAVPFLVIAVGVAVSKLLKPIFSIRYVMPALGMLWLGICFLGIELCHKWLGRVLIQAVIVVTAVLGIISFYNSEAEVMGYTEEVLSFSKAHPDAVYISGKDYQEEDMTTYTGRPGYLYREVPIDVMQDVYAEALVLIDTDDVDNILASSSEVYYIEGGEGTDAATFASETGRTLTQVGTFIMEGNATFYRVE